MFTRFLLLLTALFMVVLGAAGTFAPVETLILAGIADYRNPGPDLGRSIFGIRRTELDEPQCAHRRHLQQTARISQPDSLHTGCFDAGQSGNPT